MQIGIQQPHYQLTCHTCWIVTFMSIYMKHLGTHQQYNWFQQSSNLSTEMTVFKTFNYKTNCRHTDILFVWLVFNVTSTYIGQNKLHSHNTLLNTQVSCLLWRQHQTLKQIDQRKQNNKLQIINYWDSKTDRCTPIDSQFTKNLHYFHSFYRYWPASTWQSSGKEKRSLILVFLFTASSKCWQCTCRRLCWTVWQWPIKSNNLFADLDGDANLLWRK